MGGKGEMVFPVLKKAYGKSDDGRSFIAINQKCPFRDEWYQLLQFYKVADRIWGGPGPAYVAVNGRLSGTGPCKKNKISSALHALRGQLADIFDHLPK